MTRYGYSIAQLKAIRKATRSKLREVAVSAIPCIKAAKSNVPETCYLLVWRERGFFTANGRWTDDPKKAKLYLHFSERHVAFSQLRNRPWAEVGELEGAQFLQYHKAIRTRVQTLKMRADVLKSTLRDAENGLLLKRLSAWVCWLSAVLCGMAFVKALIDHIG